ncbi:cysteine-rich motor neuron 1 protein isoform X2 [Taeniopygia guttata]|uniref:cysteine-rich motor neuron 1 protein isoform X2 n=1 Tax=Taeniopygia guttata TaxID=59729 RepID=UPI003BB84E74
MREARTGTRVGSAAIVAQWGQGRGRTWSGASEAGRAGDRASSRRRRAAARTHGAAEQGAGGPGTNGLRDAASRRGQRAEPPPGGEVWLKPPPPREETFLGGPEAGAAGRSRGTLRSAARRGGFREAPPGPGRAAAAGMYLAAVSAGRRRPGGDGGWHLAAAGWLFLLALLLGESGTRALVCLPCDESKCEEPKSCPGSIVLGICGCCFMCARQRNESCGGVYGLHGACDRGLRCVIRPPLNGDSITEYEVGVCEDENWDDDQLLGFEPCNENLITGCNIINGKCECDTVRTCNNPFEFPSRDTCLSALKRIEEVKPTCIFNSMEYYDGDMFRMDACRFCRCQAGVSICFSAQCGELHCDRYYVPEGECCPVCEDPLYPVNNPAGCYANGKILAHGDRWREDDCTFCQCINGDPHCVATACGQSCINPVKVPGECCPVCEEPTYITIGPPTCEVLVNCNLTEKDCIYSFKLDQNGCRICQCKTREELCTGLISGCSLDCSFGFQTDAHNCEICQCRPRPKKCKPIVCDKYCPFGYLKNKHGCEICRCKKCPNLPCGKICPLGFQQNSHGCVICKCREATASLMPPVKTGSCLSMDGRRHENEESWHDGCRECYCHKGREMCALITCPVPSCANPTIHPGQCCPSCPDEIIVQKPELTSPSICHAPGGEYFVEGETWNIDSCTQCTCHSGRVLCETEVCPPLLCQNPTRTQDSCCPQCPDETLQASPSSNESMPSYCKNDDGDIFLTAESWKPNVCTSCICMDGVIRCYSESCPPVSCERPVLRKGQCCPYCVEDTVPKKVVCHFSGETYADEERWDIDSCTHCYCLQGQTLCSTVSCPPLPCAEPINVEGSCCAMCPEMYVPEPTNIPIEKTNHRGDVELEVPNWPTPGENDIIHIHRDMNHLQGEYRSGSRPHPSEDASVSSVALVTIPITIALLLIIVLLLINQKKQWIPVSCYKAPTKPSCLNNQLVYVDCEKGTRVQVDSSQRMLRIADPDSRYSGFYSMQKQNNLQADNFYQTV